MSTYYSGSIQPSAPFQQGMYYPSPEERLNMFAGKFEIPVNFVQRLHGLKKFKIAFLCDDSGSMQQDAYTREFAGSPYELIPTRFKEMETMLQDVFEGASIISQDPLDVYFMNRGSYRNVQHFSHIQSMFVTPPTGGTPTVDLLRQIITDNIPILQGERNLLIFIATDGIPTDRNGDNDTPRLNTYLRQLMAQYPNLYITFMACVSDESLLEVMDNWGQTMPRVGVVDEFKVECKEMLERYPHIKFDKSEYIIKSMLVSIDPEIKELFNDTPARFGSCCTIL